MWQADNLNPEYLVSNWEELQVYQNGVAPVLKFWTFLIISAGLYIVYTIMNEPKRVINIIIDFVSLRFIFIFSEFKIFIITLSLN